MKELQFTIVDKNEKEIIMEALRDDNFQNRKGYNKNFLNKTLALPKLIKQSLIKDIAINQQEGVNGKDYLDYTHFSIMYNKNKKLPFFTAVNIEGKTNTIAGIHEERSSDSWFQDKRIASEDDTFQYGNTDYKGTGFQKGHMVRFYDPAWGQDEAIKKTAIGDTFHYTNCCPQIGKYNAGVWNDLEDYYMARSIFQDGKISVFSGPIFNKSKEINGLLVPINFWKVIVYNAGKSIEALGFIISHELVFEKMIAEQLIIEEKLVKPSLKKGDIERLFNKNLKQWIVKISLIEEKTGIDFGLNDYDIHSTKDKLFYKNAIDLEDELSKMKHLIKYNNFDQSQEMDYTQFIQNI